MLVSVEKMAHAYGVRLLGAIEKPVTRDRLEDLIAGCQLALPSTRSAAGVTSFTLDQVLSGLEEKQFEPFFQPQVKMARAKRLAPRRSSAGVIPSMAWSARTRSSACSNGAENR